MGGLRRILTERWRNAQDYLHRLDSLQATGWSRLYAGHRTNQLDHVGQMLLIHPIWRPDAITAEAIQGPRAFYAPPSNAGGRCNAELLWGYKCPLLATRTFHADHVFPYWAGGSTIGSNRLLLCDVHNRMKGGDLHIYPWELPTPDWVYDQISRLASVIEAESAS